MYICISNDSDSLILSLSHRLQVYFYSFSSCHNPHHFYTTWFDMFKTRIDYGTFLWKMSLKCQSIVCHSMPFILWWWVLLISKSFKWYNVSCITKFPMQKRIKWFDHSGTANLITILLTHKKSDNLAKLNFIGEAKRKILWFYWSMKI